MKPNQDSKPTAEQLWEAYRSTTFRVDHPEGPIDIHIGGHQSRVDALLRETGDVSWAFVTAHNPKSGLLSAEKNAVRHNAFCDGIQRSGLPFFPGRGIGTDPGWQAEESLLILGIEREEAIDLGQMWGQNAIVFGEFGQPAELIDCREKPKPVVPDCPLDFDMRELQARVRRITPWLKRTSWAPLTYMMMPSVEKSGKELLYQLENYNGPEQDAAKALHATMTELVANFHRDVSVGGEEHRRQDRECHAALDEYNRYREERDATDADSLGRNLPDQTE
ncbi:MAG: DUF3293 domain-containing protein [Planctomycetaceae bacterium]|nr:DUF3293 domain-containing protein [Planctomycetaceae bacterium]